MKRLLLTACILCIVTALIPLRGRLTKQYTPDWKQESMTYLPGDVAIRPALLGYETTFAHYLWIRTIIYFGGHRMTDKTYRWIIPMLDMITKLCPWFYPAYEFGGLMVPDVCNNPDAARILLERGMTYLGSSRWNIAFYLGTIYLRYYDDRLTAAQYFGRAAFAQNAPREKLLAMAETFYKQGSSEETSLPLLYFLYQTSENPEVRSYLADKINTLLKASSVDDSNTLPIR